MSGGAPARGQAPPAVQNFLRFMLGAQHLERHEVDGRVIRLWFRPDENFFTSEEVVARVAIGGAFPLLHRFGFESAEFHTALAGQPVRLRVTKAEFDAFFSLSAAAMDALAKAPDQWDHSPIGRVTEQQQWQFFLKFSKYNE
jgi:hypothetical protein